MPAPACLLGAGIEDAVGIRHPLLERLQVLGIAVRARWVRIDHLDAIAAAAITITLDRSWSFCQREIHWRHAFVEISPGWCCTGACRTEIGPYDPKHAFARTIKGVLQAIINQPKLWLVSKYQLPRYGR